MSIFKSPLLFKSLLLALVCVPLALAASLSHAQEGHIAEAAQKNPALAQQFQHMMQPLKKESSWLTHFGTTAPGVAERIDRQDYIVYWGCKPHDCISESYTLLVEADSHKLVAGAFVRNQFDGPNVTHSAIQWLGETDWDKTKVLGKYLY